MSKDRTDSALFSHLAGQFLARGLGFRFQATGRSMWPTIHDGDILHVQSAGLDKLSVGDIVLFKSAQGLKAHRIVGKRAEFLATQGDAGIETDGEIRPEQIIGKVVAKECRRTGRIVPLAGTIAHAAFFWRELKRHVKSRSVCR